MRDMRDHFQQVPPSPHYTYHDKAKRNQDEEVSVEKSGLFMDWRTWVGGMIGLAVMVAWGSRQFSSVEYELKDLRTLIVAQPAQVAAIVKSTVDPVTARVTMIEKEMERLSTSRWTRADHEVWCLKTEKENADIGWKCSDEPGGSIRGTEVQPFQYYQPQGLGTQSYTSDDDWTVETIKPLKEARR